MAVEAFCSEALSHAERTSVALRLFERRAEYGPQSLYAWEEKWYHRDLPEPPARVLVGGAGSGREMLALLAKGYAVAGFEPAQSLCARARQLLPSSAPIWTLSYEEWVAGRANAGPAQLAPYDAVLLGWGSFSHVLDPDTRWKVIQLADRMSPKGPILLSFHALSPATRPASRASQPLARRLGQTLGRLRGVQHADSDSDLFLPHAGFLHRFAREEIEALAQAVSRTIRWGEPGDGSARCTFVSEGET